MKIVASLACLALPALAALPACSAEAELSIAMSTDAGVDQNAPVVVDAQAPEAAPVVDSGPKESPCFAELRAKGIEFEPAKARGVEEAVHVTSAIGGVRFQVEDTDALSKDPMACSFVLTLEKFAQLLKAHGVVKVGTLGSYCYRCCCAWSPTNECRAPDDPEPDCGENGYSNHSWGRAIDVRWLTMDDGTTFDINKTTHWVEGSSSTTCTTGLGKQTGISKALYGIVCETAQQQIFKNILTPNYNDAHRNHWHMDIGQGGSFNGTTVRAWHPTAIDVGDHADVCGGH